MPWRQRLRWDEIQYVSISRCGAEAYSLHWRSHRGVKRTGFASVAIAMGPGFRIFPCFVENGEVRPKFLPFEVNLCCLKLTSATEHLIFYNPRLEAHHKVIHNSSHSMFLTCRLLFHLYHFNANRCLFSDIKWISRNSDCSTSSSLALCLIVCSFAICTPGDEAQSHIWALGIAPLGPSLCFNHARLARVCRLDYVAGGNPNLSGTCSWI